MSRKRQSSTTEEQLSLFDFFPPACQDKHAVSFYEQELSINDSTSPRSFFDKIDAANKSIGFDFQYYLFLFELIMLAPGEELGYEVKDDIHIKRSDGTLLLIQVKHTVQKKADGSPINLTAKDLDLWKTIYNWSQIICDPAENRNTEIEQEIFLKNTKFFLFTNKSNSLENEVIDIVDQLCNNTISIAEARRKFEEFKVGSKERSDYISSILHLSPSILKSFLMKIHFNFCENDIIKRCKDAIYHLRCVPKSRVETLYCELDSKAREYNYESIKQGKNIIVTYPDFEKLYRPLFEYAKRPELIIKPYDGVLPDNPTEQCFIKQLIDIGDISESDEQRIFSYTGNKLTRQNNINDWLIGGDIIQSQVEAFDQEAKKRWDNAFHEAYRKKVLSDSEKKSAALRIIDDLRKDILVIRNQALDTSMSNGEYYHLSDIPEIGWDKDWERKYRK